MELTMDSTNKFIKVARDNTSKTARNLYTLATAFGVFRGSIPIGRRESQYKVIVKETGYSASNLLFWFRLVQIPETLFLKLACPEHGRPLMHVTTMCDLIGRRRASLNQKLRLMWMINDLRRPITVAEGRSMCQILGLGKPAKVAYAAGIKADPPEGPTHHNKSCASCLSLSTSLAAALTERDSALMEVARLGAQVNELLAEVDAHKDLFTEIQSAMSSPNARLSTAA